MTKWLLKYGFFLYLCNTILLSIKSTFDIGYSIFLGIMGLYAFLLLALPSPFKTTILNKSFTFLLLLSFLNILYFFMFDTVSFENTDSIYYLAARTMQFVIIPLSIFYHFDYYKDRFLTVFVRIIFAVILLGIIINPYLFAGRYQGVFWNPNALASFASVSFAVLLLQKAEKSRFELLMMIIFLGVSLATGSRGVLLGIALAFVYRFGFSVRNILYACFAILVYYLMLNLNVETSFNRFGTQSLLNDRTMQFYYAFETFKEKPISGWGLGKYAFVDTNLIPYSLRGYILSAHNGFLALMVQYGIFFALAIFFIVFRKSIQLVYFFRKSNTGSTAIYSYLIVYTLIATIYETMLTGINEFQTILFWFSLAYLSYYKYEEEYEG